MCYADVHFTCVPNSSTTLHSTMTKTSRDKTKCKIYAVRFNFFSLCSFIFFAFCVRLNMGGEYNLENTSQQKLANDKRASNETRKKRKHIRIWNNKHIRRTIQQKKPSLHVYIVWWWFGFFTFRWSTARAKRMPHVWPIYMLWINLGAGWRAPSDLSNGHNTRLHRWVGVRVEARLRERYNSARIDALSV